MKLQIASRPAIFALLELAQPDRQLSVGEIGEKYGVSSHHLAKVMHTLGRAGLVHAMRGAGGGYHFSGNVRRTTYSTSFNCSRISARPAARMRPGREPAKAGRCARFSARSTTSRERRSVPLPSRPCLRWSTALGPHSADRSPPLPSAAARKARPTARCRPKSSNSCRSSDAMT